MSQDALRQRIKVKLDQLVDDLMDAPNPPSTIDDIEAAALSLRERAGQIVAEEMAREQAQQQEESANKRTCSCGRWAREKGARPRQIVSMAGTFSLMRKYFYCRRCDQGLCPVDTALQIGAGAFTRRVAQEVSRVSSLLPYAGAMQMLKDLSGVSVSAKEAQRLCESAAEIAQAYLQERATRTGREDFVAACVPDVLYIESDGIHTPMRADSAKRPMDSHRAADSAGSQTPGSSQTVSTVPLAALWLWREMKVGLVRPLKANGVPLGVTRYVSHLGDAPTFGQAWSALAIEAGALGARLVVALGDGAKWIWSLVSEHFPWAIQILDFYHASEYLWEVGRAAFGEGASCWVHARQGQMLASQTEALGQALVQLAQEHPAAQESVAKTLGYFQNNHKRMDYARYVRLGLSIGSGAAESGCKQVVTQRLKGAGMHWREKGAQAIARLRCLVLSGEWPAFLTTWNQGATVAPA